MGPGESFLPCPDQFHAVTPYPRDEGPQEFVVFDFDFFAAASLQVPVDGRESREPEAGIDHPEAEGLRLGQGLAVGEGDEPLKTKFADQPVKPDDGDFLGHFSLKGADAGSEFSHC